MKKAPGGFTLIELLVVIAIISLLSAVILASLNTARSKGRNTKRASDMHQYQVSFEYYYDKYGSYPKSSDPTNYKCLGIITGTCWGGIDSDVMLMNAVREFYPAAPAGDQVENLTGYIYRCTDAVCSKYEIRWNLESWNQKCTGGQASQNAGTNHTLCIYTSQ